VDDDAIEAVINEDKKIAEQLDEGFHGRPPKTQRAWDCAPSAASRSG
jgi:hypothetical protein